MHYTVKSLIPVLSALVLAGTFVHAQPAPSNWRPTGFGGGGHMCHVAFDPTNDNRILVGSDVTGLFRSTDDGASWKASTEGMSDYYIRDIEIDPAVPQTVFVATMSGVSRSLDGGATWQTALELVLTLNPNKYAAAFGSVVVDPVDSNVVWAGVGGFRFSSTAGPGGDAAGEHDHLWFSTSGGAPGTWTGIPSPVDSGGVHTILPLDHDIDPAHPGTERLIVSSTVGVYRYDYTLANGWLATDLSGTLPHPDTRDLEGKLDRSGQVERLYVVLDSHWDGIDTDTIYDHETNPGSVYGGGVWYSDDLGLNWAPTSVSGDTFNLADGTGSSSSNPDGPKNMRLSALDQASGVLYVALTERAMRNEGVWKVDPSQGWNWERLTESRHWVNELNVKWGYYTSLGSIDGLEVQQSTGDIVFTTNTHTLRCEGGLCDPLNPMAPDWEPLHHQFKGAVPETYITSGMDVTQTFDVKVVPWDESVWIFGVGDHQLSRSDDGGLSWRNLGDRSLPPYDGYVGTNGRALYFTSNQPGSEVLGVFGAWKPPSIFELWSASGIPDDATIWTKLAVDPGQSIYVRDVLVLDATHILVATNTGIHAGDKSSGSWVFAPDNTGVPAGKSLLARALVAEPGVGTGRRILVSMIGDSAVEGGIYYRDGLSDTWHPATFVTGTPMFGMSNVESLTWSSKNPSRVYAGNSATRFGSAIAGVLYSTDRGQNWNLAAQALAGADPACFDVTGLAALNPPPNVGIHEWIYASLKPKITQPCQETTFGGIVYSDDPTLAVWQSRREGLDAGHHTYLQSDPTNPARLFTGTLGNGTSVLVENFSEATHPGEAKDMTVSRAAGSTLDLVYSSAGCAFDHVVYWETSSGAMTAPPNWTDQACFLGGGATASFDPGTPASGEVVRFVIVGNNGSIEGSYGRNDNNTERPEAIGLASCDYAQVLTGTCSLGQVVDP